MTTPETPPELRHFVGCATTDGRHRCTAARFHGERKYNPAYPVLWRDQHGAWWLGDESGRCLQQEEGWPADLILPAAAPVPPLSEVEQLKQQVAEQGATIAKLMRERDFAISERDIMRANWPTMHQQVSSASLGNPASPAQQVSNGSEVEQLRQRVAELEDKLEDMQLAHDNYRNAYLDAQAENAKLRAALAHYADHESWGSQYEWLGTGKRPWSHAEAVLGKEAQP